MFSGDGGFQNLRVGYNSEYQRRKRRRNPGGKEEGKEEKNDFIACAFKKVLSPRCIIHACWEKIRKEI